MSVIKEVLLKLEWSDSRQGPGTSMGSNDGSRYRACPICRQLQKPNGDFYNEAVGHKADCLLKAALTEIGE